MMDLDQVWGGENSHGLPIGGAIELHRRQAGGEDVARGSREAQPYLKETRRSQLLCAGGELLGLRRCGLWKDLAGQVVKIDGCFSGPELLEGEDGGRIRLD